MSAAAFLDAAPAADALEALFRCCGARRWAEAMLARRPFETDEALFRIAEEEWATMGPDDVLEALSHHPRIGASIEELRKKYASTAGWAAGEQSGATRAPEAMLVALREGNLRYEAKFGHTFVVCATGKSATQMLDLLDARFGNDPVTELAIAKGEQAKITKIRLEKLA